MKASVSLLYRGPQRECKNEFSKLVPQGLFNILYFLIKHGVDAKLYNLSELSEKELKSFLRDNSSDIFFISSFFGNHWESIKIAMFIKSLNNKAVTVLGGPISLYGNEILKRFDCIDFLVYGEGEFPALKIIDFLKGKDRLNIIPNLFYRKGSHIVKTESYIHHNIDDFFFIPSEIQPYINFVQPENLEVIITSRGCPFNCSFCSSPAIWGRKLRTHHISLIVKYLKDLRASLGSLFFSIRDDNFLANKKRVIELCKKISNEKLFFMFNLQGSAKFIDEETAHMLSLAGCNQVQMGIENLSVRVQLLFNKKINIQDLLKNIKLLRNYCIEPFGYFITGVDETDDELDENIRFIETSGIVSGVVSPLVLYPGTSLAEQLRPDFFAEKKEIIYFSKKSYQRNLSYFSKAFQKASRNLFTSEEINYKNDGITRTIALVTYLISKNNHKEAIRLLKKEISKDSENPVLYYLFTEILPPSDSAVKKYLLKLDKLLYGKNSYIKEMLNGAQL